MDNYNFLDEYNTYNEWNKVQKKMEDCIDPWYFPSASFKGDEDVIVFGTPTDDRVNSPSHYTSGNREVIDTIEDAVKDAPSTIFGMLQGQVLKYVLRVWLKDNPLEDLKKARWYLDRLIGHLEEYPGDNPAPRSPRTF